MSDERKRIKLSLVSNKKHPFVVLYACIWRYHNFQPCFLPRDIPVDWAQYFFPWSHKMAACGRSLLCPHDHLIPLLSPHSSNSRRQSTPGDLSLLPPFSHFPPTLALGLEDVMRKVSGPRKQRQGATNYPIKVNDSINMSFQQSFLLPSVLFHVCIFRGVLIYKNMVELDSNISFVFPLLSLLLFLLTCLLSLLSDLEL